MVSTSKQCTPQGWLGCVQHQSAWPKKQPNHKWFSLFSKPFDLYRFLNFAEESLIPELINSHGFNAKEILMIDVSKLVQNLVDNLAYCTLQQVSFRPFSIFSHFCPIKTSLFYDKTANSMLSRLCIKNEWLLLFLLSKYLNNCLPYCDCEYIKTTRISCRSPFYHRIQQSPSPVVFPQK